jgi:hypothetical protein
MRTPATWPLHTARRAPPTETRPTTTPPETVLASPPPETPPDAPPPLGPTKSPTAGEPLLRRSTAPAQSSSSSPSPSSLSPSAPPSPTSPTSSSPNPPSLEAILAASSDEPTDSQGWRAPKVLIAGLASLGVLVPCLVGAALVMLSPGAPPLALLPLGRIDTTASLPAPLAAPAISAARGNSVASEEPRASAPEQHRAAASLEPVTPPSPPAPVVAADPAPAPATSPASEAGADDRVAAVVPEKDAPPAEVGRLEPHQAAASPEPVASPPPAPALAAPPAPAAATSPTSEAVAEADRRIATLERERDTLAAEVDRLEHHRDSAAPAQAEPPAAPQPAGPAERSGPEPDDAALASLPEGMSARVLIRYPRNNADARRQAESLADALKRQDVEVADLRESDGAVRTGVSFFYARDAAIAQRIGGLVGIAPTRRPQMKDGLMARPGAIELSFSGDSHLAVIANSRKETVHE